jgi:hypothetical protein
LTARTRWTLALAVSVALGAAACGGGGNTVTEDQSIVVIHLNFDASVPALHQIKVSAHLGNAGLDDQLFFPTTPAGAIPTGATLALLIPTTRSGLLDLIITGLDANQSAVAMGNGQTTIAVGDRVDVTISLAACGSPGC